MYLGILENKNKELFLNLAYNLALSDGDYSEDEEMMIKSYCNEMQIELDMKNINRSIDSIIKEMSEECNIRDKKIIAFESIGLAMSDGCYCEKEIKVIESMILKFDLSREFVNKCEEIINEYINFQYKINTLVLD